MVESRVDNLIDLMVCESREAARKEINKLLYETAEKTGCSLYDLCFRVVPGVEFDADYPPNTYRMKIKLEPIDFHLDQGPGYWKKKYYNLKRQMQEIINNKEI